MKVRTLATVLAVWALATGVLCGAVHHAFAIEARAGGPRAVVASAWSRGSLVARAVLARPGDSDPSLDAALRSGEDVALRYEIVAGEGPAPTSPEILLALSLAPGRDGLVVTLDGRTEYLTPDDLLARQAYRSGVRVSGVELTLGVDVPTALALLGERFGATARDVLDRGTFRRARFERTGAVAPRQAAALADSPGDEELRAATVAAGSFLARGVDAEGRFRYRIDGATNRTLPGYDWPRHAGATYLLARIARRSQDPALAWATLRAASALRERSASCGEHRCIADGETADVGSTALAVLAFVEVVRAGLDPGYALLVPELAAFLRGQQRRDGEFMHRYDRGPSRPVDVQYLYSSGEAALALSRAHALLGDPRDLDAAKRAVTHLVGPAWSFFGSRYYQGEEHWTCQAMADLWDRSPDAGALHFCLRWMTYLRGLQLGPEDTPYDADGAYGVGPLQVPPLTPAASRCEAGAATLAVARRAGVPPESLSPLAAQLKRSLALLLRQQFRATDPARLGLVSDPAAVDGAIPATEVDWSVRIDFAQHAAGAWLGWLDRADLADAGTAGEKVGAKPPGKLP
jgi:hypothetical protein